MQPFETRYPSIYRIWDSFLAIGLTQFFQSMLDATNNLCCIVVSSTACAWKSMGAYLGFKNAAEPVNSREEDEYSDLGMSHKLHYYPVNPGIGDCLMQYKSIQ